MPDFGLSKDSLRNLVNLAGEFVGTTDTLTLTNKTISLSSNTITATSGALGDLIAHDGTSYVRKAKGTANQAYVTNSGATDTAWGTVAVGGGGTGATTLTGILKGSGTSAITAVAAPTGAILGDSDVQNVTGGKTFFTQTLKRRNPANTFTLTEINPAITADKDHYLVEPYSYIIFQSGSTIYAQNGETGGIDYSGANTDLIPVLQSAINNIQNVGTGGSTIFGGSVFIRRGDYNCLTTLNMTRAATGRDGIKIHGEGMGTRLKFLPASSLADGIMIQMDSAQLIDILFTANANLVKFIHVKGTGVGERYAANGKIERCYFAGPNTNLDVWAPLGAAVTGQVAFYLDNTVASTATYWQKITDCFFLVLDTAIDTSVSPVTSMYITGCTFYDCEKAIRLDGAEHTISNCFIQGDATHGVTGIHLTANALLNHINNVQSELNKTATNCQTILLDSGANNNRIINTFNRWDDNTATVWVTIRDNSANFTNHYDAQQVVGGGITNRVRFWAYFPTTVAGGLAQFRGAIVTYPFQSFCIQNPANTFNYVFTGSAILGTRIVTLPILTGGDTFVFEAHTQTLTNKTIVAGSNTITGIVDANITAHTTSKITTTTKALLNSAIVYTDQTNTIGAFDQIFPSSRLLIGNPAATFNYTIVGSAIAAARNVTLPLLTGNDTLVTEAMTQTLTNKTLTTPVIASITGTSITYADITSGIFQVLPIAASSFAGLYITSSYTTIADAALRVLVRLKSANSANTEYLQLSSNGTSGFNIETEKAGTGVYRDLLIKNAAATMMTFKADGIAINIAEAKNFVLGTTTGTKFGTGTTQKIGFYNATPVVQAGAITSPDTTGAQLKTAVDAIRTALINLGLTA